MHAGLEEESRKRDISTWPGLVDLAKSIGSLLEKGMRSEGVDQSIRREMEGLPAPEEICGSHSLMQDAHVYLKFPMPQIRRGWM